jgi:5'-deoxynucleotidase YfbR-like HD superfamily hydrolase
MYGGDVQIEAQSEGLLCHDVVEVLTGDLPPVRGSPLQHLFQFLDVHSLAQLLSHSPDVSRLDKACVVVVEQVENFVDAVLRKK